MSYPSFIKWDSISSSFSSIKPRNFLSEVSSILALEQLKISELFIVGNCAVVLEYSLFS